MDLVSAVDRSMGFGVCVRELTQVDEREERKKESKQAGPSDMVV